MTCLFFQKNSEDISSLKEWRYGQRAFNKISEPQTGPLKGHLCFEETFEKTSLINSKMDNIPNGKLDRKVSYFSPGTARNRTRGENITALENFCYLPAIRSHGKAKSGPTQLACPRAFWSGKLGVDAVFLQSNNPGGWKKGRRAVFLLSAGSDLP